MQTRLKVPHLATIIASAALAIVIAGVVALAPANAEASTPNVPANVSGTRNQQTITVTWDAVAGMNYKIDHTNDDKRSWQKSGGSYSCDSSKCTYTINGTWLNADYTFRVRACNADGCSSWAHSNLVPGANRPNLPSYVGTKHKGSKVKFWYPKPHGGASTYDVVVSTDNRKSWRRLATGYRQNVGHIANANAGKTYIIAVRACNHDNNSNRRCAHGWRNSAAAQSPRPSTVANVFATYTGTQLTGEWPAAKGATKYHATYSCQPGQSLAFGQDNANIPATETSRTITVEHPSGCWVSVRAGNAHGWSPWRDSKPSALLAPPTDLSATTSTSHGTTGGTITATWTAGQNAVGYNVNYRADSGSSQRVASNIEKTEHTGTVTKEKMHTVSVQSVNSGGGSAWVDHRPYWLWVHEVGKDNAKMLARGPALTLPNDSLHYKNNREGNTCKELVFSSGSSWVNAKNIHPGQKYVYSLYADSSCTNKLASAEFITLPAIYWYDRSNVQGGQVEIAFFGYNMQQNWSYKANAGPDATCKAPTSNSVDLTGLNTGQEYTYTAYSGKTCGTQVAEVTFTAP